MTALRLRIADELPPAMTTLPAQQLAAVLGGPTLFDLRKADKPPLFVSVLVHGNEPSGWDALRLLRDELEQASVVVFVGNVEAASVGRRALPGRPDFNRVWEGGDSAEAAVAEQVVAYVRAAAPRLAVDIHNNTGRNPPYAVVFRRDRPTLATARAFARRALLATQPAGVQTRRFAEFCTSVTVEVGMPDDPASTSRALAFLRRLLTDAPVPAAAVAASADDANGLALYETVARVTVSDDVVVVPDMQSFNFRTAPAGRTLATGGRLTAWTASGDCVSDRYFAVKGAATELTRPVAIGMYTADVAAARSDCLCYLLKAVPDPCPTPAAS